MSTSAAPPLANGTSVVPTEDWREAEFLQKLLRIRDEVFAGKHPRIRLPPKVLEQVAPRPAQIAPAARPTINGTPNGTSNQQLFPPRPEPFLSQIPAPNEFASPVAHTSRPFSARPASSGIDPVLLTKSDHLIRAELQLKRQQLERALKDQLDKRGRPNDEEREVLDVDDLLAQAHRLVKPVSGLRPPAADSDGESFDNSYYSSKADSWSSDEVERNHNSNADAAESLTQQGKRAANEVPVAAPFQPGPAGPPVIDLDDEPYEPGDDILEIYEPEAAGANEDLEESDYSPPPADAGPGEPRRQHGRYNNGVNGSSRRQSPTGPVPPIQNNRKRKREGKKSNNSNNNNKRTAQSPEPYIKEEPQSPPPFATYSDPPSSKRRALQPLPQEVEVVDRVQPVYYREPDPPARPTRRYEEPLSPNTARLPQRRLERDDQDLRRVASVQYARRPYSPTSTDLYAAPSPRQSRAASHVFAERAIEQPIYREASIRPSAAPRYMADHPQEMDYLPRAQSPVADNMAMAPPRRSIVVDQYGNKYYAAPVETRDSVAPSARRIEVDPYYERAMTREPALRVPARAELYEEDDIQRMPPPPRRYADASEPDLVDGRAYRREASHRPLEVEYRPHEVMERRPMAQYEEMGPPREYLPSRAYSVRPEVIRREMAEGYARHESVQPGHVRVAAPRLREVSVIRHEPTDDRRFAFATPQRRYVDEGGLERPVEAVQERFATEAPRRPTYRY